MVLTAKPGNKAISSLDERIVMVQHPGFSGVVRGPNAPYGVQGVVDHQRRPFLRYLLIGRVQGDEVDVGLNQLVQERIDGGNRCFIQT